jgi:hypothetical protein
MPAELGVRMAAVSSASVTGFDFDAFRDVVHRHMQAEVAMDIEATLSTVCKQPHYEFHPLGLIIESQQAVRVLYERVLGLFRTLEPAEHSSTWEEGDAGKFISRQRGIVVVDEATIVQNGRRLPIKSISLFVPDFATGLVKGEHIYTNSVLASVLQERLGADFAALPGVSIER